MFMWILNPRQVFDLSQGGLREAWVLWHYFVLPAAWVNKHIHPVLVINLLFKDSAVWSNSDRFHPLVTNQYSFLLRRPVLFNNHASFSSVRFVNRQVGAVSQSAKPEDPRLRRRRNSETFIFCSVLLLIRFEAKFLQRVDLFFFVCVPPRCRWGGSSRLSMSCRWIPSLRSLCFLWEQEMTSPGRSTGVGWVSSPDFCCIVDKKAVYPLNIRWQSVK